MHQVYEFIKQINWIHINDGLNIERTQTECDSTVALNNELKATKTLMKKGNATESLLNTQHFFHNFAENNLGVAEF